MKERNLLSWGNYPSIDNDVTVVQSQEQLRFKISQEKQFIPYGNGRSYGDSALASNIIYCRPYNYFLGFDGESGILHVQAGVMLSEIIELFVPQGWFLKVTPGTKYITIGGAIASDVHGKNHHIEGCFSECVNEISIMLPNGDIQTCNKGDDLFNATCGGMGLTGVIMDAKIILKKIFSKNINQITIRTRNLNETFEAFENHKDMSYSVAWIDCLAPKKELGKSLIMAGDFSDDNDLEYRPKRKINIPFYFPSFVLNKYTIKAFNWLYYNKNRSHLSSRKVDLDNFFYPLDSINNWNRIYGRSGFTQYQFILPKNVSYEGLHDILSVISESGRGSFLAVLKLYGKSNENWLSFPLEGYSLALDFKIEKGIFELLDKLDEIVVRYGGRIYLSKDSRVSKSTFERGYPMIDKFRSYRKQNNMFLKFQSLQSKRVQI